MVHKRLANKRIMEKQIEFTNKLIDFADFKKYSDTFIETGSCHGAGIDKALKAGFSVLSVEAHPPLFEHCVKKYMNEPRVKLFFGLSEGRLPQMLEKVHASAVFWLDSHPAGPNTAGHDDLMEKGDDSEYHQDKIIMRELEIIMSHRKDHIILIDDQHGIEAGNTRFMEFILSQNPHYKFFFYDEKLATFYKDKILSCIPN